VRGRRAATSRAARTRNRTSGTSAIRGRPWSRTRSPRSGTPLSH